jgi:hypothetical protein
VSFLGDAAAIYRRHYSKQPRRERMLLSTLGFLNAFAGARVVTHAIRAERGPFRNITPGGRHIHHMTFGIIGLLLCGYLWANEVGMGSGPTQRLASRATAVLFGVGAGLTLDEFALWLNLEDDYWTKQGRESIDAVVLFGALLMLAQLGRDPVRELAQLTAQRAATVAATVPASDSGN